MSKKEAGYKTLAIRLADELHAQVVLVAQLEDSSLADVLLRSVEAYVAERRSNPAITQLAENLLGQIEEDARNRRQAIEALLERSTKAEPAPVKRANRKPTE